MAAGPSARPAYREGTAARAIGRGTKWPKRSDTQAVGAVTRWSTAAPKVLGTARIIGPACFGRFTIAPALADLIVATEDTSPSPDTDSGSPRTVATSAKCDISATTPYRGMTAITAQRGPTTVRFTGTTVRE
jgi:hypothetical protein